MCAKRDNVGLLGAVGYSHIYLSNLDFKVWILCVLEILFIGSATMIQGNSWWNLLSLTLLSIELGKITSWYISHLLWCNRLHCDQKCYRSHDMYWFTSTLYFYHAFVIVFTLSISLLLLHFNISRAWTLWVILVN